MIGSLPKKPTGTTAEAQFMAWVWESILAQRINDVSGARVERTTRGVNIVFPAGKKKGEAASVDVQLLYFQSIEGDIINCIDALNNQYEVAKPYKLRGNASAIIGATTVTYSSYNWTAQTRTAAAAGIGSETQIIVPRYCVGDPIMAIQLDPDTTGVLDVPLLDLNVDARAWARKATQP